MDEARSRASCSNESADSREPPNSQQSKKREGKHVTRESSGKEKKGLNQICSKSKTTPYSWTKTEGHSSPLDSQSS